VQPAPAAIVKAAPVVSAPAALVKAAPVVSAVGKNVQAMIAEAGTRRLEFFALDDKVLESLPEKTAGSVSIHAADGSGQDNYRFDATGKIDRHLRSYGANYGAGVWEPVP
jgi:hypothetical protein